MRLEELELSELKMMGRARSEIKIKALKENVRKEGLITPLIVLKTVNISDVVDQNDNQKEEDVYYIVDGVKRFYIAQDLGYKKVHCIVHDIPLNNAQKSRYFELVLNRVENHHLDEIIALFDEFLMITTLTVSEKEFILGLEDGDFVKLDEIIQYSRENAEYQDKVYSKLIKRKMTIATAHKNIAKYEDEGNTKEVPDGVEVADVEISQDNILMNKEKPVPPDVFNRLKMKFDDTCDCCGRKETELSNVYEAHKIIPDYISQENAEKEENLALVCPTCRKAIRQHSVGRLHVNEETIYPKILEYSTRIQQAMKDTGRPLSVFLSIEQMRGLFD